jgi:cytochrome P450
MAEADIHAFDIWDEDQVQDIFGVFAEMNDTGPATFTETYGGHWFITRYEAVRKAAQDWRTFTSADGVQVPMVGPTNAPPITVDPPIQTMYRQLLSPFFSPQKAEELEPQIRGHVDDLIDDFIERGECDLTMDFAEPLVPLVFYADVMNVPAQLVDDFMRKTVVAGATPREHSAAIAEVAEELVAYRRAQPPVDDVIDATFNATIDGKALTDGEISGVIELLLLGGTDTTRNVIASSLHFMAQYPDVRDELIARPELVTDAVEEFLRMFGSVQTIGRTATTNVTVGDDTIEQGSKVICALAAANRDPDEFPNPHTFDLHRGANRHMAFGVGPHRCLGSHLARLEIALALEGILRRIPDYVLQEGWHFHRKRGFIHGPETLPVSFTPGPRVTRPSS